MNQSWLVIILTKTTRADKDLLSIRMQEKINVGLSVLVSITLLAPRYVMCVNISVPGGGRVWCVCCLQVKQN